MPQDGSNDAPPTVTSQDGSLRTVTQGAPPDLPARLGHFRIEACIGRGGLGIVYRARDQKLRRHVALKVLAETSPTATGRLLEEARAAASLMHPCIAAIHDVQQQRGVTFIVMELVEGTTLRDEMRRQRIPLDTTLRYARDIAAGLARAHDSGIVHRDLKPENVMVTPDGGIKILDFGLAREAPDAPPESSDPARTGIAGTVGYMAPEQAAGRRVDARADVFSFGVVLWEMLTRERPTDREGHLARTDVLAERVPGVTPELARLVERCLQPSPSARFADASELLEALSSTSLSGRRASSGIPAYAWELAALGALTAVVLGFGMKESARPAGAASSDAPALSPSSASKGEPRAALALRGAPEPLTSAGVCSDFPAFAEDGSLVYARHEAEGGVAIHRLDLDSGDDTALTDTAGTSTRPAAGAPGRIVYLFQKRGEDGGTEIREVPLEGGAPSTLLRGSDPAYSPSSGALLYLGADARTIRRRTQGAADVALYDAPSSVIFDSLAVSPSGGWLAAGRTTTVPRPSTLVCFGASSSSDAALDCTSAGWMTSRRAAFGAQDASLYFARDASIVRFDTETHATTSVPTTPAPTTLAIARDGGSAVFSSCRQIYDAYRVEADGRLVPAPTGAEQAGLLNVGPHGELAFPVSRGGRFALGVVDAGAKDVRVLTSAEHSVVEMAFSPDGRRVAFHDATESSGGIFVVDVDGATQPTRVTTDPGDNLPGWLDDERVLYMHPEKGLPYGRTFVVDAAGGEPRSLRRLPGVLLGGVPSRHTVLLALRSPAGDRIVESTLEGKLRDVPLRGVPAGMHWEVATAASPSGRYVTWFSGGEAWRADLDAGTAGRVDFAWPRGEADAIQPDDQGRVMVAFRRAEGQLYRVRGTFP